MELRNIDKWAKNKPKILAYSMAFYVSAVEDFYTEINDMDGKNNLLIIENLTSWRQMYSPGFLTPDNIFLKMSEVFNKHIQVIGQQLVGKILQFNPSTTASMDEIGEYFRDMIGSFFINVNNSAPREERMNFMKDFCRIPELIFLFKICYPCFIVHKTTPFVLFEKSIKGNHSALVKLLEVDKNILSFPEIQKIWEEESRIPQSYRFKQNTKALNKSLFENITISKIKITLAVLIAALFKSIGQPISRTQIRDLFDACAMDLKNRPCDQDFPDSEEGFSRAMNREIKRFAEAYQTYNQKALS